MTKLSRSSSCCKLSFHSFSASDSSKSLSLTVTSSESVCDSGRESISSSEPLVEGYRSDGWDAEGSDVIKDAESADMVGRGHVGYFLLRSPTAPMAMTASYEVKLSSH